MVVGKEEFVEYLRTPWILEKVGKDVDRIDQFFDNHLFFFSDKDCPTDDHFYFAYGDSLFFN